MVLDPVTAVTIGVGLYETGLIGGQVDLRGTGNVDPFVTPCPGQPTNEAAALLEYISAADLQLLLSVSNNDSVRLAIQQRNAGALAYHVAGGSDCRVTSIAGKRFTETFWQLIGKYRDGAGIEPVPLQSPYEEIKSAVVDPFLQTGRNIVQGGVQGAAAAAQGGATGSAFGAGFQGALPIVLVLGLALLVLLPVLRR